MNGISNPSARSGRARTACWFLAGVLSLTGGIMLDAPAVAAGPEPFAQCDRPENFGSNAQFRISQQRGRALIELTKPGTAGRKFDVEYGDELYSQKFGADGSIRLGFALTAAENQFILTMSETAPVTCTVNVPELNKIFRVILRWHDPVQLDLNVLEPGGRMGEIGNVSGARPNSARKDGIGQMDIVGGVPAEDATGEMSYVTDAATVPPDGVFGFRVDYVTRGSQPDAPYCDDNALATPRIEFIKIDGGKITTQRLSLNRARCKEKIPDNRRLMMLR